MQSDFMRYARQIILPEIGELGQQRFKSSKVLCVGAGGIGSPTLLYLAAAGIGTIGIVDNDIIDITNLQRQILFTENDCGKLKAIVAKERLLAINLTLQINAIVQNINIDNALLIMHDYDIIIDGTDNFAAKMLLNDSAVKLGKPLIYAAVSNFEGRVAVFDSLDGACYRCMYQNFPVAKIESCAGSGILGPVVGIVGMVVALEALKLALGNDICKQHNIEIMRSKLWVIDTISMMTKILIINKKNNCMVCSVEKENIQLKNFEFTCNDNIQLLTKEEVLTKRNLQIVDVRERSEWDSGHIDGAIHIPLDKILNNSNELGMLDKDEEILVYCKHGIRSLNAAKDLKNKGYDKVCSLKGGIVMWQ